MSIGHGALGAGQAAYHHAPLDDDISPCALDDGLDLSLLGLGHAELVERLPEIVEKGLPFRRCDHEKLMRLLHGAARVPLRPSGSPAEHFRNEIFEACRWNAMMSLVYLRICIMLYTPPSRLR